MKFDKFLPESKKLAIEFGGDTLNVEYEPSALIANIDDLDDIDEADDEQRNVLAERLCDVLISWDAEGPLPFRETRGHAIGSVVPDGEQIPLDPEKVQFIPVPALVGILVALNQDAIPDPKGTRKRSRRRG